MNQHLGARVAKLQPHTYASTVELVTKFDTVSEWRLNASTCYHKALRLGWKDKAWKESRRLREEQEDE